MGIVGIYIKTPDESGVLKFIISKSYQEQNARVQRLLKRRTREDNLFLQYR